MSEKKLPIPMTINDWLLTDIAKTTYFVDNEVIKTPKSMKKEPSKTVSLNSPKSVALPEKVPIKKRKKIWTLPTQLISDGGWPRAET